VIEKFTGNGTARGGRRACTAFLTDRFESDILHQIALYKDNSYKGTCRDKE